MKKTNILLLALISVFVVIFCAGCAEPLPVDPEKEDEISYKSLVYDFYNDGIIDKSDVEYWNGIYFYKDGMAEKSCSVNNKIYNGKYSDSIIRTKISYVTDMYEDEETHVTFGLNSRTGDLVSINNKNNDFWNRETFLEELENPQEYAILVATQLASQYVDDIYKYKMVAEKSYSLQDPQQVQFYNIKFYKEIDGFATSDFVSVQVTRKGTVAVLSIGEIGAFDAVDLVINQKSLNKSISEKVENVYNQRNLQVKKINIEEQQLAITPDGEVCMCSTVIVDVTDESGNETQTGVAIITILIEDYKRYSGLLGCYLKSA